MIFYYIKKSFLVYRNCFLKEFDRFETEPICQILYLLPRSLLSEVSSSHIIQGKIYKPPPPLWKLPLGSSHFPSQISILVNLSKHVSSNPRVESSVPVTTVNWHLWLHSLPIPAPVGCSFPQSRLQKTEAEMCSGSQLPCFTKVGTTVICQETFSVFWKVTTEKIQAIHNTEYLYQVLLPKVLFYTRVANEYCVQAIQDAEVIHEHIC